MDEYLEAMDEDVVKAQEAMKRDLAAVRTGRATPSLVDKIPVNVVSYGTTMPLNQLATIQAPDPRLLVITPWDKTTFVDIERAVVTADLGLNPSNDGKVIRVPVPALTAERRQDLVKQVKRIGEETKVRIRQVRREYNDTFKEAEKDGEISEDDLHRLLANVQEVTDVQVKKVDEAVEAKEAEVLEV
ncbi:MAG: ribosome recycling factor [Deltaproteobacteria bacterium]|nr:ribosome recycling factor [Deltaproteobacteria bacterium]MBW2254384.1 ribosome recycling factor [Deltaproteobacteria bacterium]